MKKIGVITHYYNSHNYGGMLQAYAMINTLFKLSRQSEQLCFAQTIPEKKLQPNQKINLTSKVKQIKKGIYSILKNPIYSKIKLRNRAFYAFELKIPHSSKVYTSDNVFECVNDYDTFITGSDQVWNMDWYYKEYFLDFVPDSKRKISYAASMPNTNLSYDQKQIICEHLKSFDAISVREKETANFLSEITVKEVEWVLDPTLLLSKDDWDKICTERVIKEKYIFCYFLGEDKKHRTLARKFAKKVGYKIVTLPHLGRVNKNDIPFGHFKLYDISPEQFISLIKHAEYVITDSFHATVFSNIYQTKYFVLDRVGIGEMSSRIKSLVSLTGERFRFCTGKNQNANYMLEIKDILVPPLSDELLKMREKSIEFLKKNLG